MSASLPLSSGVVGLEDRLHVQLSLDEPTLEGDEEEEEEEEDEDDNDQWGQLQQQQQHSHAQYFDQHQSQQQQQQSSQPHLHFSPDQLHPSSPSPSPDNDFSAQSADAADGEQTNPPDELPMFKVGLPLTATSPGGGILSALRCDWSRGTVYLASSRGELIMFDFHTQKEKGRRKITVEGKEVSISAMDCKDSLLVLGLVDGRTLLYSLDSFEVTAVWSHHTARVSVVQIVSSYEGTFVYSTAHDGYFLVREAASPHSEGRILHSFISCSCPLSAMVVEPAHPHLVWIGGWDGSVKQVDLQAKQVNLVLKTHPTQESAVRVLALTPSPAPPKKKKRAKKANAGGEDGGGSGSTPEDDSIYILLIAHGNGELMSWDFRTNKQLVSSYGHGSPCTDCITSLQVWHGRVYAASDDQTIRLFDLMTGEAIEVLMGHAGGITAVEVCGVTQTTTAATTEGEEGGATAEEGVSSDPSQPSSSAGGPGNELLISLSFDGTARAYKLAAVEAAVQLKQIKNEEAREAAFEAFLASKTKPKGSKKAKGKGSKKKKGADSAKKKKEGGGGKAKAKSGKKKASAKKKAAAK